MKDLQLLNERTWLQLGQLAETMMEPERAVLSYESALRHNPFSEQTLTLIAALCRSLEQYGKAADYFQRILKINEVNGEIWGALGHCYLMLDDLQKAYNAYQSALYHLPDPKEPKLWYGIGILYDRYGSFELAEEAFSAVIRMDPTFEKANEIYFRLGIIYKQERKFDLSLDFMSARDAYEKVLSENPKHAKVLQQLGWLFHQSGTPFCSQDRAISCLKQSLDSDPSDAQTWYLLGRCYMAQQKYNEAYDAYQQAVYRNGRNPTFWCSIGVLYYQINQYSDALDAYSRAIRLNPYISEVWYDLGTLYESCNNQVADALDAYTRALELDQGNVQIKQRLQLLRNSQAGGAPVQALQPQQPTPHDRFPVVNGIQTGPSPHYQQGQMPGRDADGYPPQQMSQFPGGGEKGQPPPPFNGRPSHMQMHGGPPSVKSGEGHRPTGPMGGASDMHHQLPQVRDSHEHPQHIQQHGRIQMDPRNGPHFRDTL
ncbi:hypothetical protein BSLG_004759 [Batrachochytrium salamandrivorans]|nr:hypothetical protein BSLG_004759 [Batrachochytrium salamandrivorans]